MTPAELMRQRPEAEAELKRFAGVVGVGVGVRERGGRLTDELVLRVYVEKKKPKYDLAPDKLIPATWRGVPTDVLEVSREWKQPEPERLEPSRRSTSA